MSNVLFTLLGKIAIDSSSAEKTIDDVTESAKGLSKQLDSTGEAADNAAANTGSNSKLAASSVWLGNMLTKATNLAYRFGKSIVATGMDYNKQVESQTATLATLMNVSTEEAKAYYKELEKFAEDTPLSLSGVMENAIKMLNYGFEQDEVIPTLQMLGDIALGRDETLSRLVLAYTQVGAYTKLRAQEAYQFIEAGASVYEMLRDQLGISTEELADMQEKGLIDFDTLDAALSAYTDENGRYYGAMQRMMETGEGQQEKIKDTYQRTLGNLLAPFYDEYVASVMPAANSALEKLGTWVSENQESLKALAEAISNLATYGLEKFTDALQWLSEHGVSVADALTALGAGFGALFAATHPVAASLATIVGFLTYFDENGIIASAGGDLYDENGKLADQTITPFMKQTYTPEQLVEMGYDHLVVEAEFGLEEGSLEAVQAEVEALNLQARVQLIPTVTGDISSLYMGSTEGEGVAYRVNSAGGKSGGGVGYSFATGTETSQADGSHASGLNYVPRDNYIARLHLGEAVLPRHEADAYRNGENATADTGRLETLMQQVLGFMQQVAANTATGQTIVLDSGALVGSTVRQTDAELGKITTRKGRRN